MWVDGKNSWRLMMRLTLPENITALSRCVVNSSFQPIFCHFFLLTYSLYLTLKRLFCLSNLVLAYFFFLASLTPSFSSFPSYFCPLLFVSHPAACTPAHPSSHVASRLFLWTSTSNLKCIHIDPRTSIPHPSLSVISPSQSSMSRHTFVAPSHRTLHQPPTEKKALLAPGLQVRHPFPEQHLQQILQGKYFKKI